jgi:hypothetical protein
MSEESLWETRRVRKAGHSLAEPQWDFTCEQDHGCDPLPVGRDVIELVQDADPRPRHAEPES